MDIYDKLHEAAYCHDLTVFVDKLIDFAESVLGEKNRATKITRTGIDTVEFDPKQ